jgi:hypothetical protein
MDFITKIFIDMLFNIKKEKFWLRLTLLKQQDYVNLMKSWADEIKKNQYYETKYDRFNNQASKMCHS